MLKTETNTTRMNARVKKAAIAKLGTRQVLTIFEHGQWWVVDHRTGAQYSVIDAEGESSVNGFDFEQVTQW